MRKANPINIHVIDHMVLRTNDLKEMVMFHSEVLGCRLTNAGWVKPDSHNFAQAIH